MMRASQQYLFIDFEFTMPGRNVRTKEFFAEIIEVGIIAVVDDQVTEQFSKEVPWLTNKLYTRYKTGLPQ